jgi:hypothetical protein
MTVTGTGMRVESTQTANTNLVEHGPKHQYTAAMAQYNGVAVCVAVAHARQASFASIQLHRWVAHQHDNLIFSNQHKC